MNDTVNIEGLDKAELLHALWLGSDYQGRGWLQADIGEQHRSEIETFERIVERSDSLYFDYVLGKPIKVDLSGPTMDTWLYNRDSCGGLAEEIVSQLRTEKAVT